jgi:hypothetical protein
MPDHALESCDSECCRASYNPELRQLSERATGGGWAGPTSEYWPLGSASAWGEFSPPSGSVSKEAAVCERRKSMHAQSHMVDESIPVTDTEEGIGDLTAVIPTAQLFNLATAYQTLAPDRHQQRFEEAVKFPAKSHRKEAPRRIQVTPLRKHTVTVLSTFALVIGCILTGMSATAAPTANPHGGPSASEPLILACGGVCPGICPCPSELRVGSMFNL